MCLKNYTIGIVESEAKANNKKRLTYEERITIEYLYKKSM